MWSVIVYWGISYLNLFILQHYIHETVPVSCFPYFTSTLSHLVLKLPWHWHTLRNCTFNYHLHFPTPAFIYFPASATSTSVVTRTNSACLVRMQIPLMKTSGLGSKRLVNWQIQTVQIPARLVWYQKFRPTIFRIFAKMGWVWRLGIPSLNPQPVVTCLYF